MAQESLRNLKNAFGGERVFLIGNGPSINETPLDRLRTEYTFGVNKIYRKFDETDWRPDLYFNVFPPEYLKKWDGGRGIEEIHTMAESGIRCFLNAKSKHLLPEHDEISYFNRWSLHGEYVPFHEYGIDEIETLELGHLHEYWSDEISYLVYEYHSMYSMMQISAYLGFDTIYLVGCDLGMEYVNPHMIFERGLDPYRHDGGKYSFIRRAYEEGKLATSVVNGIALKLLARTSSYNSRVRRLLGTTRADHFDPEYWENRLKIQDGPSLDRELIKAHVAAKRICADKGIAVYNATVGGELEVFERRDIDSLV